MEFNENREWVMFRLPFNDNFVLLELCVSLCCDIVVLFVSNFGRVLQRCVVQHFSVDLI